MQLLGDETVSGSKRQRVADDASDVDACRPLETTPVRRPRLPVEQEPDLSTSGSSAALQLASESPGQMARHARKHLILPASIAFRIQPSLEDVSADSFLSYLAGFYITKHCLHNNVRFRVRGKKAAFGARDLLFALAAGEQVPKVLKKIDWKARNAAKIAAAAVFADHYPQTLRIARNKWSALWLNCSVAVKNIWAHVVDLGYGPDKFKRPELTAREADVATRVDFTCPGALFTWQTDLGRNSDIVQHWVDIGIGVETLCDLMQGDSFCQSRWQHFRDTVAGLVHEAHFVHWSCAMEVCTKGAQAVVHLHAFGCVDWENYVGKASFKVTFCLEDWRYGGIKPHVVSTNISRNACAKKVVATALFYCCAPKFGSVFQFCSLTPGEDPLWPLCRRLCGFARGCLRPPTPDDFVCGL